MFNFIKKNKFQILRFIIVGVLSTLLNFFSYSLIYYFTSNLSFASFLGYSFGLLNSFYFSNKWVFQNLRNRRLSYSVIIFLIIYSVGGLEMTLVINIVNSILLNHKIAWLCGVIVAAINNYLCSKYFLFNR